MAEERADKFMAEERADKFMAEERAANVVEIAASDLPLHCPLPSQALWNAHPRVFLAVESTGEAQCPYCGTLYRLAGGAVAKGH